MDFKNKVKLLKDCEEIIIKIHKEDGVLFQKITNTFSIYLNNKKMVLLFRGKEYHTISLIECEEHLEVIDATIPLLEHYIIEVI